MLRHRGQRQAELRAEAVEVSRDLRFARFRRITHAVLYRDGEAALEVQADEILLDRHTNDLQLHEAVITSPQGDRLEAPDARWIAAEQRLIFPRGARVSLNGSEIRAAHLVVDLGLEQLELAGDVDITFRLDGAP